MTNKEKIITYIDKLLEKYPKNYYLLMVAEFIDNLEGKEVDLEKEISFQWSKFCLNGKDKNSFVKVAKHFFKLRLKAKDWKNERMKECPFRQVGCTMYDGNILECKGACSWVVDNPKLKELKSQNKQIKANKY